jgi:hypothetical protein
MTSNNFGLWRGVRAAHRPISRVGSQHNSIVRVGVVVTTHPTPQKGRGILVHGAQRCNCGRLRDTDHDLRNRVDRESDTLLRLDSFTRWVDRHHVERHLLHVETEPPRALALSNDFCLPAQKK